LIVFAFCAVSEEEARRHRPFILAVDARNQPDGGLRDV
jgi:aspartate 1-decarboxylase